jgi:hypothetical protein
LRLVTEVENADPSLPKVGDRYLIYWPENMPARPNPRIETSDTIPVMVDRLIVDDEGRVTGFLTPVGRRVPLDRIREKLPPRHLP